MRDSRRAPRKITQASIQAWTGRYLERYATSSAHLRRLLVQRVERSVAFHGDDLAEKLKLVDEELARLQRLGLVDDARFARDRARLLHRRGQGRRRIQAALFAKGLSEEHVAAALAELGGTELEAAQIYARKRRLGRWRTAPLDAASRQKELGKLARAGFSWEVARQVVEEPEREPDLET